MEQRGSRARARRLSRVKRDGFVRERSQLLAQTFFTPEDRLALQRAMTVRPYPAGTLVFAPGDSSEEFLYYLITGRVVLYLLAPNGKRLVTRVYLPDGIFGSVTLLGREPGTQFAEATEDCTIGRMDREQFVVYLKSHADLVMRLLAAMGHRLSVVEQNMLHFFSSPVVARIAGVLLEQADPVSGILSNATHEELGDLVGAMRPTVTKALDLMRAEQLIRVSYRQIQIIDRSRLEDVVRHGRVPDRSASM